jgi:surface antigen
VLCLICILRRLSNIGLEYCIRTPIQVLGDVQKPRLGNSQTKIYRRMLRSRYLRSRKRVIRYGILAANVVLLVAVLGFVMKSPNSSSVIKQSSVLADSNNAVNPLDQLSSADIAVNVARMTNLYEAASVTNNADSINSQLAVSPSSDTVVAKPQVVSTALRSIKDLQKYTTVAGDTVSGLAAKFSVTSDTIKWSNNLASDTLAPGLSLWIPPVNGIAYTVQGGETADTIAAKFHANKDAIVAFNDAEVNSIKAGQVVVIPDGTKTAVVAAATTSRSSYGSGFAWGGAAIYGYNGYDYGYCTWYVANRRAEIGRPVPSNLGNAYSWYRVALGAGMPAGFTPQVGAVAVNEAGNHVSVVEQVNDDGSFWVSEMNSHGVTAIGSSAGTGGWGVRDYKLIAAVGSLKFIY